MSTQQNRMGKGRYKDLGRNKLQNKAPKDRIHCCQTENMPASKTSLHVHICWRLEKE